MEALDSASIQSLEASWNNRVSRVNGNYGCPTKDLQSFALRFKSVFRRPEYADDTTPVQQRQETPPQEC